jgi:dihydroorotate dehydrogenase electron transfer subunit
MPFRKLAIAEVIDNISINSIYFKLKLRLHGLNVIKPGQFLNLKLDNIEYSSLNRPLFEYAEFTDLHLKKPFLFRPFSVGRVIEKDKSYVDVEFLMKEVGTGSYILHHIKKGANLNYIGPLGNNFKIKDGTKKAFLIAGGTGLAPLLALADELGKMNITTYLLVGGSNRDSLPVKVAKKQGKMSKLGLSVDCVIPEIDSEFCITGISTDDGSLGYKGFVTDLFKELMNRLDIVKKEECSIYSCGPTPMMKEAHKITKGDGFYHQVSLERHMACGLGVCLSCVNKIKKNEEWENISICTEGPVFDADEVIFNE